MTCTSRTPVALLICALLASPFLLVTIPPLTDVPGHMGSSAVAAYSGDPAFARLMAFRWHLVPNLGTDLIVAALQGALGVTRATWVAAALIPPLLAAGILLLARTLNPRGAAAAAWALIFIYSFPLNYGFLNYMLGVAGSLIGLSLWIRLDARPRLREAAAWAAVPLLFLCHVVAGCLLVLFVAGRELAVLRATGGPKQARLEALPLDSAKGSPLESTCLRNGFSKSPGLWRVWAEPSLACLGTPGTRSLRAFVRRVRPLLSSVVILVLWRLDAQSFAGRNRISVDAKYNAVLMLLRDQDMALDVGSVALAAAVFALGWRRGARPHPAVMPALLGLVVLFLATPSSLSGSSYADARLLPLLPMLAFATQDWSRVGARLSRFVAASGLALLAVRLCVTAAGFAAYDARYSAELAALAHIPEHSRVIVLINHECDVAAAWRGDRLDHLGEMAIVERRSWTNSEWDVDGAHLLQIRYRPSPQFYDDPSQFVWPTRCGGLRKKRPTLQDALDTLPFDGIDELWLINASLPDGYRNPRLAVQWQGTDSTLYSVLPAAAH